MRDPEPLQSHDGAALARRRNPMIGRTARILRATQAVALLVFAALGAAVYVMLDEFDLAAQRVEHSHRVLEGVEGVRLATLRSGTWLRNHAMVPKPGYLAKAREQAAESKRRAAALEVLTRDDPEQHERARLLKQEVDEVVGRYLALANIAERDGLVVLHPLIERNVAADHTQGLRELLGAIERAERGALDEGGQHRTHRLATTKRLLAVVLGTFGLFLGWSVWYAGKLMRAEKATVQRLRTDAKTDPLTGLLNRRALESGVAALLARGTPLALLALDLDHFKPVNDRFGHAAGDRALQAVAARLKQECRADDLVARVGGDEFVIVLPAADPPTAAAETAQRLQVRVAEPILLDGQPVQVGSSVGVAIAPADGDRLDQLLATADARLYSMKHGRRSRPAVVARDTAVAA